MRALRIKYRLALAFVIVLLATASAPVSRATHLRQSRTTQTSAQKERGTPRPAKKTHAGGMRVSGHVLRAQPRLVDVSRRSRSGRTLKRVPRKTKAPVVSRAQMDSAEQMARDAYRISETLAPQQRVALLSRLLYTMRPEVMATEKKQWAEELFTVAQRLTAEDDEGTASSAAQNVPHAPPLDSQDASSLPALQGMRSFRNEAVATAAARLALYDSDRALLLLDTLASQRGRREDPRTMAARLVFATYMQQHGAAGAQTLLAHARRWGEHGGFPYGASTAALARLSSDEDAAEEFFRQLLTEFERGQEGAFGIADFAALLERAVAMEAISEDAAEQAGRAIVSQVADVTANGTAVTPMRAANERPHAQPSAHTSTAAEAKGGTTESGAARPLSAEAQQQLAQALANVRAAAPKAYTVAIEEWPALAHLQAVHSISAVEELKIDPVLQATFGELAQAMRLRSGAVAQQQIITRGLQRVNELYKSGAYGAANNAATNSRSALGRLVPDRQSLAFVSLAAYASPFTIAAQLRAIEDPFWRAYFLAIAAQQVGEPTRVADPTARRVQVQEEAESEDNQSVDNSDADSEE